MRESTTVVLTGPVLELWSLSRVQGGLSCLRTIHAATAARAWAALAVAGLDARRRSDPRVIDAMLLHVPLSRPTATTAGRVVQPVAAVGFFVDGRTGDTLHERAIRLVREVTPILAVAA